MWEQDAVTFPYDSFLIKQLEKQGKKWYVHGETKK